jgi:hypothetical protein
LIGDSAADFAAARPVRGTERSPGNAPREAPHALVPEFTPSILPTGASSGFR